MQEKQRAISATKTTVEILRCVIGGKPSTVSLSSVERRPEGDWMVGVSGEGRSM